MLVFQLAHIEKWLHLCCEPMCHLIEISCLSTCTVWSTYVAPHASKLSGSHSSVCVRFSWSLQLKGTHSSVFLFSHSSVASQFMRGTFKVVNRLWGSKQPAVQLAFGLGLFPANQKLECCQKSRFSLWL